MKLRWIAVFVLLAATIAAALQAQRFRDFRGRSPSYENHPPDTEYPVRPSAEALKLGLNFVMYSMTH